ncbi:uncharacterized protein LOC120155563 [Hibiscus syriacus]|uniref:uncharacterized protein LOC120155563 n=1 Tax=Hibiscus syriacus TaxID=106335 RepID=UPI001924D66C|nr:uncharacterized protein LOC120155563 [Hibiscus syriacus]
MELIIRFGSSNLTRLDFKLRFVAVLLEILLLLLWSEAATANLRERDDLQWEGQERGRSENIVLHSCIHDQMVEQRRRTGHKVYSVTPQVYKHSGISNHVHHKGRSLLGIPELLGHPKDAKQPLRIFLNYDAVPLTG